MTAMDEFLGRLASPNFNAVYIGLDETWNARASQLNARLAAQDLPVRVSQFVFDLDGGITQNRPVTTGCCNTICAPKGWR